MPTKVFLSYAHEDEQLKIMLEKHLSLLKRQGLIDVWHDRDISAGTKWKDEIDKHLNEATIILLLISPDFLASDYCYSIEMQQALERHEMGEAWVIPIIIRHVYWQDAPFSKLQALPTDAIPVMSSKWDNIDEAFFDITRGIRKAVSILSTQFNLNTELFELVQKDERTFSVVEEKLLSKVDTYLWNVPFRRNPFFTGREADLLKLHEMLTSDTTIALTQPPALSGLGGIGKTQIAIEYAYRYQDEYQTVCWVRADQRDLIILDFVSIADSLNFPEVNDNDQNTVVKAVKNWLDSNSRWLLIFDNADDLTIIQDFLPVRGNGHILLTTRSHATGNIANCLEVDKMTAEQGSLFLLRRSKVIASNAQSDQASEADYLKAKEISEVLDGLSLALDQAGAYIEETGCTLSDYLNSYQKWHKDLLLRRGALTVEHPQSVTTTFSLCFQKVQKANKGAADLLRLCAFLPDPDIIGEHFIKELILQGRFGIFGRTGYKSYLRDLALNPLKWNSAIEELLKYSLIRWNPLTRIVSVHRLVQAVLKDGVKRHEQNLWKNRANADYPSKFLYKVLYKNAAKNVSRETYLNIESIRRDHRMTVDRFIKESLTSEAKTILSLAQEEAQRLQHDHIGTEHLLLGIIREGEGVGAMVLSNLGVELNKVRSAIEFIIGRGDSIITGEIPLSFRVLTVFKLAIDEAERLNHDYVGSEHLLLGLIHEGKGNAVSVLESLGVKLNQLRSPTLPPLERKDRDRFNHLTERTIKVLSLAQEEAQRLQHNYIGTEHLLLGIIREGEGIAAKVLTDLDVDLEKLRKAVEEIIGHGDCIIMHEIGLTLQAQKVIELALDEARGLHHHYLGTQHLLLGLIREGHSYAADVLASLGLNLEQLRTQTIIVISQRPP